MKILLISNGFHMVEIVGALKAIEDFGISITEIHALGSASIPAVAMASGTFFSKASRNLSDLTYQFLPESSILRNINPLSSGIYSLKPFLTSLEYVSKPHFSDLDIDTKLYLMETKAGRLVEYSKQETPTADPAIIAVESFSVPILFSPPKFSNLSGIFASKIPKLEGDSFLTIQTHNDSVESQRNSSYFDYLRAFITLNQGYRSKNNHCINILTKDSAWNFSRTRETFNDQLLLGYNTTTLALKGMFGWIL